MEPLYTPSSGGGRRWKFGQCFGNRDALDDLNEADLLTAVRFDETGDFLATGDKGGRIVIFKRGDAGSSKRRRAAVVDDTRTSGLAEDGPSGLRSADYKFYTEFQSHESEFDYLKSLEIEEKINQITWCKRANSALFMLSTNDKTIKLWKVHEKAAKAVANINVETGRYGAVMPISALRVPTVSSGETAVVATPRRVYANAHAYHINSLSVNSDGQTFLSADDLRVNVWNLDNPKLSYNVVDIKPPSLEELTEVITAADFHPFHCHMFMYASSRGTIKIADMRASALCDRHAKLFEEPEEISNKSYFSEIIASVSDVEFSRDGRYVVSRDYLSIKVWDLAMEARPVRVIPVHDFLKPKLVELYETDCIFDKFEVATAGDGTSVMTGSYNNSFKIYDVVRGSETTVELTKAHPQPPVVRRIMGGTGIGRDAVPAPLYSVSADPFAPDTEKPWSTDSDITMGNTPTQTRSTSRMDDEPEYEQFAPPPDVADIDFSKKVLHFSWHPSEDIVAVAGVNSLYVYHAL